MEVGQIFFFILLQEIHFDTNQIIFLIFINIIIYKIPNHIMLVNNEKVGTETRGRPKKEETRTLAPIYKKIFSDNSAIVHTTFLIYVFQVFIQTKNEKRVGHKDGGFTIFDRVDSVYCFDDIEKRLQEWGYYHLLAHDNIKEFIRILPALGPRLILRQILKLLNKIVELSEDGKSEQEIYSQLKQQKTNQQIDLEYPHMRFVLGALKQLKLQKFEKEERMGGIIQIIKQRVRYLWQPLLKILIHTVLNSLYGKVTNKYFKPFFSDAENPHDTYIGQLNLDQIVAAVEKNDNKNQQTQRILKRHSVVKEEQIEIPEKVKKVRSIVDPDGQRHIVQIIKPPKTVDQNPKPTNFIISRPIKDNGQCNIYNGFMHKDMQLQKKGYFVKKEQVQQYKKIQISELQKKAQSQIVSVLKQAFQKQQEYSSHQIQHSPDDDDEIDKADKQEQQNGGKQQKQNGEHKIGQKIEQMWDNFEQN